MQLLLEGHPRLLPLRGLAELELEPRRLRFRSTAFMAASEGRSLIVDDRDWLSIARLAVFSRRPTRWTVVVATYAEGVVSPLPGSL